MFSLSVIYWIIWLIYWFYLVWSYSYSIFLYIFILLNFFYFFYRSFFFKLISIFIISSYLAFFFLVNENIRSIEVLKWIFHFIWITFPYFIVVIEQSFWNPLFSFFVSAMMFCNFYGWCLYLGINDWFFIRKIKNFFYSYVCSRSKYGSFSRSDRTFYYSYRLDFWKNYTILHLCFVLIMIYYFCVFYDTDLDSLKRDFYVEYFIGCMYLICNLLFPFFFFHFFSLYVFFYDWFNLLNFIIYEFYVYLINHWIFFFFFFFFF
jgi:hypothetical protein